MPGEAGKQLFEEYPLSDQSVAARAHGREGGKAGKGTPKPGAGGKNVPQTGGSAKGAQKGVSKKGKAAKGAAHWRAGGDGAMQTPQEFLLALQQAQELLRL
jgi:hypothetical protein